MSVLSENASTYLTLDRPVYEPSDLVRFRSVTLSSFELRADDGLDVEYYIQDAQQNPLPGLRQTAQTSQGVASGAIQLPPDTAAGRYILVANNKGSGEVRRDFFVHRQFKLPRWAKKIDFTHDSYGPGDQVSANFEALGQTDGVPAAGLPVSYQIFVDGEPLAAEQTAEATNDQGQSQFDFQLPATIRRGDAVVMLTVRGDGVRETATKPIPVNLGQVEVEFYPEGGELVAGVPNRIYFHARDPAGKPVHLEAVVIDDQDDAVRLTTEHQGRGQFSLVPHEGRHYRVEISRPAGVSANPNFPAVGAAQLSISTGPGVFSTAVPLRVILRATNRIGPVVLLASCRGATVGLERVEPADFAVADDGAFAVERPVQLAPRASGVIRITAYDYSSTPKPLAERLVFVRAAQHVQVQLDGLEETYQRGERVNVSLTTTDETGRPLSAVLGTSVVAESILRAAPDPPPALPTYFYLTTAIENAQDLENADFYLQQNERAERALDLLLGTQGWRRFIQASPAQLAERAPLGEEVRYGAGPSALSMERLRSGWSMALHDDPLPKVVESSWSLASPTASLDRAPQGIRLVRWLGTAAIVASFLLATLILADLAVRRLGNRLVWGTIATAALLLVVAFQLRLSRSPKVTSAPRGDLRQTDDSWGLDDAETSERDDAMAMGLEKVAEADRLADTAAEPAAQAEERYYFESEAGPRVERIEQTGMVPQDGPPPAAASARPSSVSSLARQAGRKAPSAAPSAADVPQESVDSQGRTLRAMRLYGAAIDQSSNRSLSKKTLVWRPWLITDGSGKQTLSFDLPPEGATFRLRIDAHSAGRLGAASAPIVSQ